MERRYLTAKRHYENKRYDPTQESSSSRGSVSSTSSSSLHNPDQPRSQGGAKNIASARMKRLRESLQKDLEDANASIDFPPAKRFAPSCEVSEPQEYKTAYQPSPTTTNYKSPRKSFTPYTNIGTPKTSVNKRLQAAVTSTPSPRKNVSQFLPSNAAGTSATGLLNDEDVDLSYISNSSSNYSAFSSAVSNESLICHANESTRDDLENMDWSPVSEEQLLSNLREARESLSQYHQQKQEAYASNNNKVGPALSGLLNSCNIYIVVDTNIFIDKLQTVINIMHISYMDNTQPVVYAPWMVIQELEYFKNGYSVSKKNPVSQLIQARCRKAVRFINDTLIAGKQNFKGQPVQRAAETRIIGQSPDDSILASCMQLYNEGREVVLLSSDINLRNKALINNIRSYSPNDIIKELKKKAHKKDFNFVEAISKKLSLICSFILHFELKAHYGEQEYENKSFKDLPWQYRDCIKYLSEHYDSAFRSILPKQCRKVVDDLHEILSADEEISNEVKFMELCLSLLIYLQTGLPKYDANIQNTIQEIKQIESEYLT